MKSNMRQGPFRQVMGSGGTTAKATMKQQRSDPNIVVDKTAPPPGKQLTAKSTPKRAQSLEQTTGKDRPMRTGTSSKTAARATPSRPSTRQANGATLYTTFKDKETVTGKKVPPPISMDPSDEFGTLRVKSEQPEIGGLTFDVCVSWTKHGLDFLLSQPKARQLFKCYLEESFAEENLLFLSSVEELTKAKTDEERLKIATDIAQNSLDSVNLNSLYVKQLHDSLNATSFDMQIWRKAHQSIMRLLNGGHYPAFKRSDIYIRFLERLLPKSDAEKWKNSFDELLENPVGRWMFRKYLRANHAEENLRFLDAVVDYKQDGTADSKALRVAAKAIEAHYLVVGAQYEICLVSAKREALIAAIENESHTMKADFFDAAVADVKLIMKTDPYVRFLESPAYQQLKK